MQLSEPTVPSSMSYKRLVGGAGFLSFGVSENSSSSCFIGHWWWNSWFWKVKIIHFFGETRPVSFPLDTWYFCFFKSKFKHLNKKFRKNPSWNFTKEVILQKMIRILFDVCWFPFIKQILFYFYINVWRLLSLEYCFKMSLIHFSHVR